MARKFVIHIPVADLRKEPKVLLEQDYSHQDNRETQLLFGERAELIEEQGEWLKIAALEQLCFDTLNDWYPYRGWVHRTEIKEVAYFSEAKKVVCAPFVQIGGKTLSYGTLLSDETDENASIRKIPKYPCRSTLVDEAKCFLEVPYLWGGRSFPLKNSISSVDCSGLINLLYRAQGVSIPRNAHEQYLKSIPTSLLKAGDPLFLAKEKKISHVLLKMDDKSFIESPETGKYVRMLT